MVALSMGKQIGAGILSIYQNTYKIDLFPVQFPGLKNNG